MSTEINNTANPHPTQPFDKLRTQPYFLPRRVIPLTAFTRRPAWQRLALALTLALCNLLLLPGRWAWDALYLWGKERAAEEAR